MFQKLYDYLFTKKLEICLIGLENTGKTLFCKYFNGDSKTKHGNNRIKCKARKKKEVSKRNIIK